MKVRRQVKKADKGDASSNRDSSASNEEATDGEEEPRRSTRVRRNRHLQQDYIYY